jgi:ribosomal protein S27AE
MKACFKCQRELPLSEFYRHPHMGDGYLNKCKACARADAARVYREKTATAAGLQAERERGREKYHRLGYSQRYRGKGQGRHQKDWQERWPEKRKAHGILGRALRTGKVTKPEECQECGASGVIHGHHPDYTKPLDVMWLCVKCHFIQHRKEAA